jgi:hypothetical protein
MKNKVLVLMTCLCFLCPFFFFKPLTVAGSNWLSRWENRIPLDIKGSLISSDLSDYPLLVRISARSGISHADDTSIFYMIGSASKKIAVTTSDGVTQCHVEVVRWDTVNKIGVLYVKVPYVVAHQDCRLYLYYDVSEPDNIGFVGLVGSPAGSYVWSNGYSAVYHFSESGHGTAGEYKDSTSNHLDGTGGDVNYSDRYAPVRGVDDILGYRQNFDGGGALITLPDADVFSITDVSSLVMSYQFTINTLHNPTVTVAPGYQLHILGKGDEYTWVLYNQPWGGPSSEDDRSGRSSYYVFKRSGGQGCGWYFAETDSIAVGEKVFATAKFHIDGGLDPVTYYYIDGYSVHASDNGTISLYKNGDFRGSRHWQDGQYTGRDTIHPFNGSDNVYIGGRQIYNEYFEGTFAELRFSSVDRSDSWVKADSYNLKDGLVSYGSAEVYSSSPPVIATSISTATPTAIPAVTPTVTPSVAPVSKPSSGGWLSALAIVGFLVILLVGIWISRRIKNKERN